MLTMSTAVKSVLYSLVAAGAGAAVHAFLPAAYQAIAGASLATLLLNLRNAWHLPEGA